MISLAVNAASAISRLKAIPPTARAGLALAVQTGTRRLLSVVKDKLSGDVLNVRSGALRRSIVETGLVVGAGTVTDSVVSDGSVAYARIQEYGGRVNLPEIVPKSAKALAFEYGGRLVFARHAAAHVIEIPERSYLRASLDEQLDSLIHDIRKIVTESLS
jgi:hypothetical protein